MTINNEHIFLHYNVDFGINLIGQAHLLYLIPAFGLIVFLLNLFIYGIVNHSADRLFISHILFGGALAVNIILFISAIAIYLINLQ